MKKRSAKQIAHAGTTLIAGMVFLPFIPLNKKSRWSNASSQKTTSKLKRSRDTKI